MKPGDLVAVASELEHAKLWETLTWDARGYITMQWIRGRASGTHVGLVVSVFPEFPDSQNAYVVFPSQIGWTRSYQLDVIIR